MTTQDSTNSLYWSCSVSSPYSFGTAVVCLVRLSFVSLSRSCSLSLSLSFPLITFFFLILSLPVFPLRPRFIFILQGCHHQHHHCHCYYDTAWAFYLLELLNAVSIWLFSYSKRFLEDERSLTLCFFSAKYVYGIATIWPIWVPLDDLMKRVGIEKYLTQSARQSFILFYILEDFWGYLKRPSCHSLDSD